MRLHPVLRDFVSSRLRDFNDRKLSFLFLSLLLVVNPITLQPGAILPYAYRDSDAYIALAMNMLKDGLLYLPSWGHVDTGLILPPLYPFLIAIANLFTDDLLHAAREISAVSMILVLVPIYLYLVSVANVGIALVVGSLIMLNSAYVFYGLAPLTEPLFLFLLCTALYLSKKYIDESNSRFSLFGIGALTALVCMSRQVGIALFVFIVFWILFRAITTRNAGYKTSMIRVLLFVSGWAVIFCPYALVLYAQTGHAPFEQSFREMKYSVETDSPQIIAKIQRLQEKPEYSYESAYLKRRYLRELLPDSSEMLSYVGTQGGGNGLSITSSEGMRASITNVFRNPGQYLTQVLNNFAHFEGTIGIFLLIAFGTTCLTPLLFNCGQPDSLGRLFIPIFIIFYLMIISAVGANIARYVDVIYPLALTQIGSEVYFASKYLSTNPRLGKFVPFAIVLLLSWCVFVTPKYFFDVNTVSMRRFQETDLFKLAEFKKYVKPGDPIFSLFSDQAYYSGGTFRVMPNDSLEKVVGYGKRTGVRWILVSKTYGSINESYYNVHARWYRDTALETRFPHLIRYCCNVEEIYFLYEIR